MRTWCCSRARLQSKASDGTTLLTRPVGKGKVVVAAGPVLEPAQAGFSHQRQIAYAFLCGLVGANYTGLGRARSIPRRPGSARWHWRRSAARRPCCPRLPSIWSEAWKAFAAEGRFTPLAEANPSAPTPPGQTVNGAVAATLTVPAGKSVEVPFLLAWHYPNKYNAGHKWMGCHYATQWPDARAVLREAVTDFPTLASGGRSCSARPSTTARCPTGCWTASRRMRPSCATSAWCSSIANGDVYGWEGSNGCCDPTCTHVWGYEQSLSRLFPALERDMRRIDFMHQQRADGGVNNRTDVPSPPHPTGEQPFADGHASCILKAYREALNQPDDKFLQRILAAHQARGRIPDRPRCQDGGRAARGHLAGRPVEHLRRGAARRHHVYQRLLPGGAARGRGVGSPGGRPGRGGALPRRL